MKLCASMVASLLALTTAGCATFGKPKPVVTAPAPPAAPATAPSNEPLSVPQTHVELPPAQALSPDAFEMAPPPPVPAPTAPPASQPAPATRRPPSAATSTPPKPDPAPPVNAEPAPVQPAIQEVLPEGERNQLREKAAAGRKRIQTWLDSGTAQHLTGQNKLKRDRIQSFLKASLDAENRGDMREADQLAERGELLIRELQSGR